MKELDKETIGVVLLNLGGPDSLRAVRPFLFNLFSDREIITLGPALLQKPIAWMISTLRSRHAQDMYSKIGGKSPILDITTAQAVALEKVLNNQNGPSTLPSSFKVYVAMRYWHPFSEETLNKIAQDGIKKLIVLTLYPHYSKATTGSSIEEFKRKVKGKGMSIEYIEKWHDFPLYIESLAELIAKGVFDFGKNNFDLLYSAHSLPQSFLDEGDPYLRHIEYTISKVNERLAAGPYHMPGLKTHLSFQSKTGPVKWIEPSTEDTIIKLADEGCKNLFVVPISFVSDHIETLYEIDILYKDLAEKHGITLKRCESLNTYGNFINTLRELINGVNK